MDKNKQLSLFPELCVGGNEVLSFHNRKTYDYAEFINKFEGKKTTDDCYTPREVYDCVLSYCKEKFADVFEGKRIERPFYPGGDYKSVDYTDAVVVDNPPFSIISSIVKFYNEHRVKFFLFAPALTLFNIRNTSYIITNAGNIVYENGARVNTAFITNFPEKNCIIFDSSLGNTISAAQQQGERRAKKLLVHDKHVITGATIRKYLKVMDGKTLTEGIDYVTVNTDKVYENGRPFGGCYVVSDGVSNEFDKLPTLPKTDGVYKELTLAEEAKVAIKALGNE